ncbi:ATP-binding protein [Bradyrhizobium sp. KB893862 SZCCT0404]|uniref:ATP-binding protein n=1 Tax=Bradyrhizobium sp. KB893862 SZCCT0404 TaxID=2807672 RepID=UPI001BAD7EC0|nr:ATP-binding protein [Bradyrhizobium sp. KB893862 SZCCT0404]MBR1178075.1 ATP-binding protein [Bradyrhizobium sp. KB893862 SZCCT0404]
MDKVKDGIERLAKFDSILIEHPRLGNIREKIQWLLGNTSSVVHTNEARRAAAKGRPCKMRELWVLPIVGPSGSMKSTSIGKVVDEINADPSFAEDDIPVLLLTMRGVRTSRAFLALALESYGDAAHKIIPGSGPINAQVVVRSIYEIARIKRTLLLVIDEAHELLRHDGGKTGHNMAMLLKTMVNEGIFSVVLVGTEEMLGLFRSRELKSRTVADEDATLRPFDITKAGDRAYFFKFLQRVEDEMVKRGVVDEALGWVSTLEDRAKIYDMCEGVPGIACRVLRIALERTFRRGRTSLEWADFESAFRAFNATELRPLFDPFAEGPHKATLGRLKAEAEAKKKGSGKDKDAA